MAAVVQQQFDTQQRDIHELNVTVLVLFLGLLLIKSLHWIANLRMENFARGIDVDLVNNNENENDDSEWKQCQ